MGMLGKGGERIEKKKKLIHLPLFYRARQDYHRLRNLILKNHRSDTLTSLYAPPPQPCSATPITPEDIKNTGWLVHIQRFLSGIFSLFYSFLFLFFNFILLSSPAHSSPSGAKRMALALQRGISVVVHCSDGWDRTPVLSALCQLMLDPFYRSIRGFEVLVEKEFCSFGHKFQTRVGHHLSMDREVERAPIFVQFIECVWQLSAQFEKAFEFNEAFLHLVLHHLFSCRFGTFLCNSEYERKKLGVSQRTDSLWTIINSQRVGGRPPKALANPLYDPDFPEAIFPNSSQVKFWEDYYRSTLSYL